MESGLTAKHRNLCDDCVCVCVLLGFVLLWGQSGPHKFKGLFTDRNTGSTCTLKIHFFNLHNKKRNLRHHADFLIYWFSVYEQQHSKIISFK